MIKFEDIADNLQQHLEELLSELKSSSSLTRNELKNINGIYVLYESGIPVYVGRSNKNRLRKRIAEHSATYSNHLSATLAFRILKDDPEYQQHTSIATDHPAFLQAKKRVAEMTVRVIEINDPVIQTIFEPYAAHKLKTIEKYNRFDTH